MRVLLASNSLDTPGGSESYLITLAIQLQRLGHDVWLTAGPGNGTRVAADAGLRTLGEPGELTDPPDRIVSQDAIVAGEAAASWPSTPQLLVSHSGIHDLQLPGALPPTVAGLVALNDRVADRARALGTGPTVHRLTQPVDVGHFTLGPPPRTPPRRVLLIGNNRALWRSDPLIEACKSRGIEVERVGAAHGRMLADPAPVMREADIVIGYGRGVLEAMASGRTALVFDRFGSDGWVTVDSYAALESTGFNGTGGRDRPGRASWDDMLDAYDPDTGAAGHDLALRHHDARAHATTVVDLLRGLGPVPRANPDTATTLARIWREQWRWESQALHLAHVADSLRADLRAREVERDELGTELHRAHLALEDHAAALALREAEVQELSTQLASILASRRYRMADRVGRLLARLRR